MCFRRTGWIILRTGTRFRTPTKLYFVPRSRHNWDKYALEIVLYFDPPVSRISRTFPRYPLYLPTQIIVYSPFREQEEEEERLRTGMVARRVPRR